MAKYRWSPGDVVRLRNLVADDRTALELADAFRVSIHAIYRKLRALNLYITPEGIRRGKSAASKRMAATPEGLARLSRAGKSVKVRHGFVNARAAQAKAVEVRYEGVPLEHRDLYRRLVYSKHTPASVAKAMIAEMIEARQFAADKAKFGEAFARQLAKVRAGAVKVERRADLWKHHGNDNVGSYGIASGMLV